MRKRHHCLRANRFLIASSAVALVLPGTGVQAQSLAPP